MQAASCEGSSDAGVEIAKSRGRLARRPQSEARTRGSGDRLTSRSSCVASVGLGNLADAARSEIGKPIGAASRLPCAAANLLDRRIIGCHAFIQIGLFGWRAAVAPVDGVPNKNSLCLEAVVAGVAKEAS